MLFPEITPESPFVSLPRGQIQSPPGFEISSHIADEEF